jgi:hypothetical protein
MTEQQLTMPFLQQDSADEIAHAVVARLVDIVHQESCPSFRWSERANLKLCRARADLAAALRLHLKKPTN